MYRLAPPKLRRASSGGRRPIRSGPKRPRTPRTQSNMAKGSYTLLSIYVYIYTHIYIYIYVYNGRAAESDAQFVLDPKGRANLGCKAMGQVRAYIHIYTYTHIYIITYKYI